MDPTKLADLKAELLEIPENPNPKSPYGERRTLVIALLDEITFLRQQQGYSFTQISTILQDKTGVEIKPLTLKKYFFEEIGKLKGKKSTGPRRRKASPGRSKSRSAKAAKPVDETTAVEHEPKKVKAKAAQAPAKPLPEPKETPVATAVSDDDWGINMDDDDDDSYTTGLVKEPRFNTIRRS